VLPRSVVERADGLIVKSLPPKLVPPNTIRVICRKRAGSDELDLTEGAVIFLEALREAGRALSA
jgi:hypothetical protein